MNTKQQTYDVVVVGAGNAALCAAISAREGGARVLILEKAPKHKRGGNSYFTDGAIRFAYQNKEALSEVIPEILEDHEDKIQLPSYTDQDFLDDLIKLTDGKTHPKLAKQLAEQSFPTIKWMNQQGVQFKLNDNQMFEQDGKKQFWGGLPVKTHKKGIGLIETLLKRAKSLEIDIKYESRAVGLDTKEGKIVGLKVEKNGVEEMIKTDAVILACGGFEANKEMRVEYLGDEWKNAVVRGTEYNTGDGLAMAIEVGAQTYGQWDGCHAHTTDFNAPRVGDFQKPGDIYKKSSYPVGLIVNKKGERFVDEGADYRNYTYAKYGKETLKQPDQLAFQIFDSQVSPLLRKEYHLEEATCIKAESIEELAQKMEVDKEQFMKTIKEYNDAVQDGTYDPSIKDGKGTKGINPPKSNWALKFEKGPFYAYPVTCGITFTFGALHVDETGKVLDKKEHPIPGLFAAGEMVGGLFYNNYPGGSGLMSGAVFGKLSGESAAAYVTDQITEKI